MMQLFGLIGYPLTHSFSKEYFTQKFTALGIAETARYELFPLLNIQAFLPLLQSQQPFLQGLNVTIPYKISVMPFLSEMDDQVLQIGSVNTITISPEGSTKGYNTDVYGFEQSLLPLLRDQHRHALILGGGGAAKAVVFVLNKLNIGYTVVSRHPKQGQLSYQQLTADIMHQHTLVINTTPLGMYPSIGEYPPIPYQYAGNGHLFYDLIYRPERTVFLQNAARQGAAVKNGLEMLHLQAERAWQIWNNPI